MQRLKTRPQFQATMAGGVVAKTAHFALHRLVPAVAASTAHPGPGALPDGQGPQALFAVPGRPEPQTWLGALIPKRWAKRSVTRHALKRQVYAVGDAYADQLPVASYVVRLRAGFDRKQFLSATSDVLKQAARAELQQLFATGVRRKPGGPVPSPAAPAAPAAPVSPLEA